MNKQEHTCPRKPVELKADLKRIHETLKRERYKRTVKISQSVLPTQRRD